MGQGERDTWIVMAVIRKAMAPCPIVGGKSGEWEEKDTSYLRPEDPVPKEKEDAGHYFARPSSRSRPRNVFLEGIGNNLGKRTGSLSARIPLNTWHLPSQAWFATGGYKACPGHMEAA